MEVSTAECMRDFFDTAGPDKLDELDERIRLAKEVLESVTGFHKRCNTRQVMEVRVHAPVSEESPSGTLNLPDVKL